MTFKLNSCAWHVAQMSLFRSVLTWTWMLFAFVLIDLVTARAAHSQTNVPPYQPWAFTTKSYCSGINGADYTFASSWPGDDPIDLMQDYVTLMDALCSGSAGAPYVVTHTLLPCTPTIGVYSNGVIGRSIAKAEDCKFRRHVNPKPGYSNQPYTDDRFIAKPEKRCQASGTSGTGAEIVLTGPSSYAECRCPAGSDYVTHNGLNRCMPVIEQTLKPPDMCVANPIQPATGNKRQTDVDYVGTGIAPLTFRRTYNSASSFERKWISSFDRTSVSYSGGGYSTHLFQREEGSYPLRLSGSAYVADVDVHMSYSGSILRLDENRRTERYTSIGSNKLGMDRVRTLNGTVLQTVSYSTASTPANVAPRSGLPIMISDAFGRALNLTYNAQGRMATMTDPGGGLYQYAYDSNGNLQTVTYPDGAVRQYVYNELAHTDGVNQPHALTGIVDESNQRYATFGYNTSGLAVFTEHGTGVARHEVSYAGAPSVLSELVFGGSNNVMYVRKYYQPPSSATIVDAIGQARQYTFSQLNGSTKTTGSDLPSNGSCSSIPQARSFDSNGNQTETTDFNGHTTTYSYDLTRNLETSRTEASGTSSARTITTQWHATLRLPAQIDEPGRRTTFTYDANGNTLTRRVLDTASSVARVWTYTYNNYGQVLTANGPRTDVSDVTTYTYYNCTTGYQCGQVHTITNALGHVTAYDTYDAHGLPLTITDPNGVVTTLTYDLRQRLTSRTVGTEQTTFEYWPTGLLKKTTLPDGSYLEYTYDAAHRLTGINDSEGNRIHYTLDTMGNRTSEQLFDPSNALRGTRTQVFNTLNQLWKQIGAAGGANVTTTFGYDNNGNQTSIAAPLARNTSQTYDELNRLKTVTDPESGLTTYGYNALDQLISVTDPKGLTTSYTYNALGDLQQQVSADTGTTTNTYDSGGNLKTSTDARNKTATYDYDALNRVTSVTYPDQVIGYTYDTGTNQKGRLTQITDNSGSTSWTYDAQGRVLSRQQTMGSISKSVGYGYDASGRLQTLTLPSGNVITYGYANGKVVSLALNGSTTLLSNVLYHPFGPTTGWTWGNSTFAVRDYDQDGKITLADSAGLKTYAYDDAFRITGITDASDPALSQSYGYDLLDRLTSATGASLNQSWTYDANGNRFTQGGSQSSTYTVATTGNRIDSITGTLTRTYGYDNAGNTTSDGSATYTYNDAGRMISATKAGATSTYALNGLGQRVRKTTSGSSTYFVYDEAGHLIGEYDNAGALIAETVWFGDIPVVVLKSNGGGAAGFYIHTDHLNTPRKITRPSDNAIVWRWDSDPFGATLANENPSGLGIFAYSLRFPGQYFDSETGLHYNYFRDYDPATGRYVESDPIGLVAGVNTFAYVHANPLSLSDPTGLEAIGEMSAQGWGVTPKPEQKQRSCAITAFRNAYLDMRAANWVNSDKYFHCRANCEATKCGPYGYSEACNISEQREWFDQTIKDDSPVGSEEDRNANSHGRAESLRNPRGSCQVICSRYRPPGLPSQY